MQLMVVDKLCIQLQSHKSNSHPFHFHKLETDIIFVKNSIYFHKPHFDKKFQRDNDCIVNRFQQWKELNILCKYKYQGTPHSTQDRNHNLLNNLFKSELQKSHCNNFH